MNRRDALTVAATIVCAFAASGTSLLADPRVADLVQAGKIRVALFPPQYTEDPATGELRPFAAGIVSMGGKRGRLSQDGVLGQINVLGCRPDVGTV